MSLIELFDVSEISSGEMRKAELPCGKTVAVYNVDGEIFATADLCTHEDVSLCDDGSLLGGVVECGWHYGTYDVKKVLKNTKDLADPNMVRFFFLSFKCIARPYQQFYFLIL